MKKNIENSGAPSRMPTTLAPVSVLKRKIRNGTRGGCERSSIATNAPISATDSASRATILVELRSTAPASTPFGAARGGELSLRCLSLSSRSQRLGGRKSRSPHSRVDTGRRPDHQCRTDPTADRQGRDNGRQAVDDRVAARDGHP